MEEKRLTSLGILAQKIKVSKSKLSYYDSLGLIIPIYKTVSGMRLYDEKKVIKRIEEIKKKRSLGLSLKEIKELKK